MWGSVEKGTNCTACNANVQLINRIKEAFGALPRDTMKATCERFRSRIEAVEDAEVAFDCYKLYANFLCFRVNSFLAEIFTQKVSNLAPKPCMLLK